MLMMKLQSATRAVWETTAPARTATRSSGKVWRIVLIAGAVALIGYFLLPGERPNQIAYLPFGWAALIAFAVVARRQPRGHRLYFVLFGVGVLSFTIGDAVWASYRVIRNVDPPYPSIGDFFWLGAYVFWAAGHVTLLRGRRTTRDRGGLIDALIILTGVGLLQWVFFIQPHLTSVDTPILIRLTSAAYPIGDLILLALAARLFVSPGSKTPAFWLLMGGFVSLLIADVTYGVYVLHSPYHRGNLIDAGWLGAYLLFAVAALHPSMRRLAEPVPDAPTAPTRRRLAVLALISLIAPALIATDRYTTATNAVPLAMGAAILFLLVLVRMAGLVRELHANNKELAEAQRMRGRLLRKTVRAAENERIRLAAELHDGPIQRLSALALTLEQLKRSIRPGSAGHDLLEVNQGTLSLEIKRLRRMMNELRPPALDAHGLAAALRDHVTMVCREAGLALSEDIHVDRSIPEETETILYRVAQEALNNVVRHAGASEISVSLIAGTDGVRLVITDDGAGFDPSSNGQPAPLDHFGLVSMRERVELAGGAWTLRSAPGDGTRIEASIPLVREDVA